MRWASSTAKQKWACAGKATCLAPDSFLSDMAEGLTGEEATEMVEGAWVTSADGGRRSLSWVRGQHPTRVPTLFPTSHFPRPSSARLARPRFSFSNVDHRPREWPASPLSLFCLPSLPPSYPPHLAAPREAKDELLCISQFKLESPSLSFP
jgi:hypothetical protein